MSDAIGALRARITLQSPTRAGDDIGGGALDWADEGGVWASIDAVGASLSADFDSTPALSGYRVVLNARDDVRAGWRVLWGARVLRVTGVRNDGAARIELDCEEEVL